MTGELSARPLGTPDTFRPLIVRPHPRLDPPGTRCRVDGIEVRNPATIRAEPPLASEAPDSAPEAAIRGGARGPGHPKATTPSATAQQILKLLRKHPEGLSKKDLYPRLHALGFGAISRQCLSYHLNRLCSFGLARVVCRSGTGAWGDRPRRKNLWVATDTRRSS